MGNVIRLTESDLTRIVRRVIIEQKESELLQESFGDLMNKIKSHFNKNRADELENEIKEGLDVDSTMSKNEVIEKVKTFFKNRMDWIGGNVERMKNNILRIAKMVGSAFKIFIYILLIFGETSILVRDPFTFLGIAIYLFLQGKTKIGNKEIVFKN